MDLVGHDGKPEGENWNFFIGWLKGRSLSSTVLTGMATAGWVRQMTLSNLLSFGSFIVCFLSKLSIDLVLIEY